MATGLVHPTARELRMAFKFVKDYKKSFKIYYRRSNESAKPKILLSDPSWDKVADPWSK